MISTQSKPAIALFHGAFLLPSTWNPIIGPLQDLGYEVVRPAFPSTGGKPTVPDMSQDIAVIRQTVDDLLDRGKDVMVVSHSYGGLPVGTALEGLDSASRAAQGKPNSVVRLVYINSYLVPEGTQLNPVGTRDNMIPHMVTDFEQGLVTLDPALTQELLFQDLTDEQSVELTGKLQPQSIGVFWDKTTFAAWRYIPTTYVRCMKDLPSTVTITAALIEAAKASGGKIDRVIEREVGHCPYISQPDWTVEMLRRETGDGETFASATQA